MPDFMIIGLPRSATTWAANWLTSGDVFCMHDPLYKVHYSKWDTDRAHFPHTMDYRSIGVSCTGIWRWPDWCNAQDVPKIVVMREIEAIQQDLDRMGLPSLTREDIETFHKVEGKRVYYRDLFDPGCASEIWEHLVGPGYCAHRHAQLVEFNVQPNFLEVKPDPKVTRQLYDELSRM